MPINVNINDFRKVTHNEDGSGRDTGSGRDLSHVGGDPDIIDVWIDDRSNEIGPGRTLIWLSSANKVTWYKEIKAINSNGLISLVSTQDSQHGPSEMTVDTITPTGATNLIFNKAKFAGAHTDMYQLNNINGPPNYQFGGKQLSFYWVKD